MLGLRLTTYVTIGVGTLLMAASVAFHDALASTLALAGTAAAAVLAALVLTRRSAFSRAPSSIQLVAMLPALASVFAFLAYAVVLNVVHNHELSALSAVVIRTDLKYDAALKAANSADTAGGKAGADAADQLLHALRRLTPEQFFARFVVPTAVVRRQFTRDLREGKRFAAIALFARALPGRPQLLHRLRAALQRASWAEQTAAAADRAARRARFAAAPSFGALPGWFADLGTFFPLAAQILAGLIVALAVGRRVLSTPVESQLRIAMGLAMIGVVASIIGSLPHLHRGLQGFLLGYVCAGYAGALSALGLFGSGLLSEAAHAVSAIEPSTDNDPGDREQS